jgi:catechol 2,3-dioxygenase-like lactoylglutathione lyase family enzyme
LKISLVTVIVKDQQEALHFYTDVLGFVKKLDVTDGGARRLTLVSPEDPEGPQLVLELNDNPAFATYQRALFYAGIPMISFRVKDVRAEHDRLQETGVAFSIEPGGTERAHAAMFNDTCGNLVQIYEEPE